MSNKRYRLVYTGKLGAGMDEDTVISNLVLDIGLSEEKVKALLKRERAVLKHFDSAIDANKAATKLEKAGLICRIEDSSSHLHEEGESSMLSFFSKLGPTVRK